MARKTKEDAEKTRQRIVAAAREVFRERGVSRTTLEQVARAAGVTRGAIYWHFENKEALFRCMREEVALPFMDRTELALFGDPAVEPLARVEAFLGLVIDALTGDEAVRATFEILTFKCEYVDSFAIEQDMHRARLAEIAQKLTAVYEAARDDGTLRPGLQPARAAWQTICFLHGLIDIWLLDRGNTLVRGNAGSLIATQMQAVRSPARARRAPR